MLIREDKTSNNTKLHSAKLAFFFFSLWSVFIEKNLLFLVSFNTKGLSSAFGFFKAFVSARKTENI